MRRLFVCGSGELVLGPRRRASHPHDAPCQGHATCRVSTCMWMYSVKDELASLGFVNTVICRSLSSLVPALLLRPEEPFQGCLRGWLGFGFAYSPTWPQRSPSLPPATPCGPASMCLLQELWSSTFGDVCAQVR